MAEDGIMGGAAAENIEGGTVPPTGGAAPQGGENLWGFLPDGMQALAQGYEKPEVFWVETGKLHSLAKEREAVTGAKPDSLVSDEEYAALWKSLGMPEAPDGYALPEVWSKEGVSPEVAASVNAVLNGDKQAMQEIFHDCKLTGKQAEALYGYVANLIAKNHELAEADQRPVADVLKELWPQDQDRHLDAARRGAAALGIGTELDAQGLSANPLVLKLAHALGERLGESGLPGNGGPGGVLPTGDRAREELYRVVASDAYKRNDPDVIRKAEALSARIDMR